MKILKLFSKFICSNIKKRKMFLKNGNKKTNWLIYLVFNLFKSV